MTKDIHTPDCFGDRRGGNAYAERSCHDCPLEINCIDETEERSATKNKKTLDPKWIDAAIDLILGPNMAFLDMQLPEGSKRLRGILVKAVQEVYDTEDLPDKEFILAVSLRLSQIYGTYTAAKLEHYLVAGVEDKPRIITPNLM